MLLLGAYQDVMGDLHNLFGAPADADVIVDREGRFEIPRVDRGDSAARVLGAFGFEAEQLVERVAARLAGLARDGALEEEEAASLTRLYEETFARGTYLRPRE